MSGDLGSWFPTLATKNVARTGHPDYLPIRRQGLMGIRRNPFVLAPKKGFYWNNLFVVIQLQRKAGRGGVHGFLALVHSIGSAFWRLGV